MEPLQWVSLALDLLLVVAALVAYRACPRIGGDLSAGLRILLAGVILGFTRMRLAFEA